MRNIVLAALVLAACSSCAVTAAETLQVVHTEGGEVSGARDIDDVRLFADIPYAAAPTGERRWRPPQAAPHWQGVRAADHFGPKCPQLASIAPLRDELPQSENCLNLNIWTPARTAGERLPVMVWIHGGAFLAGDDARYFNWNNGATLASRGVVLVAMNYRLGVLGFLALPQLSAESPHRASGDYGLMDVIAALRWVKRNISAFGGDPGNVTLFGQSAGAEMTSILLVSPPARGLFQKAIIESGGSLGWREPKSLRHAQRDGTAFLAQAGASSLAALRKIPAKRLLRVHAALFEPVVDGYVYPVSQYRFLRSGGRPNAEAHRGLRWRRGPDRSHPDAGELDGGRAEAIRKRRCKIPRDFSAASDSAARLAAKQSMTVGTDFIEATIARLAARNGARVYQFRFDHPPPTGPAAYVFGQGAYHGAEVPYAFHSLGTLPLEWTAVDYRLEHVISSYWVNFARTGNPNGPGLPHWPTVAQNPVDIMTFGDTARLAPRPNEVGRKSLKRFFYGPDGIYARGNPIP